MGKEERLPRTLGWLSIGLGLPPLLAAGGFAQMIGVNDDPDSRTVLRLVGLRELTCAAAILMRPRPVGWLWARVAGDVMDLALLSEALASKSAERDRITTALLAVVGITVLDVRASIQLSRRSKAKPGRAHEDQVMDVKKAITVNRSPEEVYQFWHDFGNLPRFMQHLESVQVLGAGRSHWKAKAPAGTTVEWDAEVTDDRPNELIAWHSVAGADVDNAGSVRFRPAPGGRGTEVRVELKYDPPGGVVGVTIAKLFGEEPTQQVYDDLRVFKQVMETGEIVNSDASIHQGPHAAQPPKDMAAGK